MKYLISATPNDHINFILEGFDGWCCNSRKKSVFTEASRWLCCYGGRYKHVDHMLQKKKCINNTITKCIAIEKKNFQNMNCWKFASLRIHIEKVRRIRTFNILHIYHHTLDIINAVITVAAVFTNLQESILRIIN